ncbi:MAG: transaldolase [Sedimentisphaeraceae bacterium JB056]
MVENPLRSLSKFGQSIWLDYISRQLIESGQLAEMIKSDALKGMTSNPSIFQKAISKSTDYNEDIAEIVRNGGTPDSAYELISQKDVRTAADEFRCVFDATNGLDGYVSLEVNPHLAYDTQATIDEAKRLWASLGRQNVFIKVPSTIEGLDAIEQIISEGINVNVTLLFSVPRYRKVVDSYFSGLEKRLEQGKSIDSIASVASFFLSRIDSKVDPILSKIIEQGDEKKDTAQKVYGQTAVSSAKIAYQVCKELHSSKRFKKLEVEGARQQRLLWASTSTKNPEFDDVKYVEELIGSNTVNTMPPETVDAYRDHGNPRFRLEQDLEFADWVLQQHQVLGINLEQICQELEDEGVKKFIKPFDDLMHTLKSSIEKLSD